MLGSPRAAILPLAIVRPAMTPGCDRGRGDVHYRSMTYPYRVPLALLAASLAFGCLLRPECDDSFHCDDELRVEFVGFVELSGERLRVETSHGESSGTFACERGDDRDWLCDVPQFDDPPLDAEDEPYRWSIDGD